MKRITLSLLLLLAIAVPFASSQVVSLANAGSTPTTVAVQVAPVQTIFVAQPATIDFFSATSLDDLNAQLRTFKTQASLRAALGNFYRHFPLILWKSGDPLPSGFAFDAALVSDANFPELFPVFNRRPLMLFGYVIVPAPGYDPTQPTIYGERALPIKATVVINQAYSIMYSLPQ